MLHTNNRREYVISKLQFFLREQEVIYETSTVKIADDGLNFYFHFLFYFSFYFLFFSFSIFRTTRVRGYQSQLDGVVTRLITGYRRRK